MVFGEIKECQVDERGIRINHCTLTSTMKNGIEELVTFLQTYPLGLMEEAYGFIYDFLIRFGIQPRVLETAVLEFKEYRAREKQRRENLQLTNGVEDSESNQQNDESEGEMGKSECSDSNSSTLGLDRKRKRREIHSSEEEEKSGSSESSDSGSESQGTSDMVTSSEDEDVYRPSSERYGSRPKVPRSYRPWELRRKSNEKPRNSIESRTGRTARKTEAPKTKSKLSYQLKRSAAAAAKARQYAPTILPRVEIPSHLKACPIPNCKTVFLTRDSIVKHYKYKHSDQSLPPEIENQRFQCPGCDRVFKMECYLEIHYRTKHNGGRPKTNHNVQKVAETETENEDSNPKQTNQDTNPKQINEDTNSKLTNEDSNSKQTNEDLNQTQEINPVPNANEIVKRFLCPYCPFMNARRRRVIEHGPVAHPGQVVDENNITSIKVKKQVPRNIHNPPLEFQCTHCPYSFDKRDNFRQHARRTHGIRVSQTPVRFQCTLCDSSYCRQDKLSQHIQRDHPGSLEATAGAESNMEQTMDIDSTAELVPRVDSVTLPIPMDSDQDQGNGLEQKRYACTQCKSSYSRQDGLSRHLKRVHPKPGQVWIDKRAYKPPQRYHCTHCDLNYTRRYGLKKHFDEAHPGETLMDENVRVTVFSDFVRKSPSTSVQEINEFQVQNGEGPAQNGNGQVQNGQSQIPVLNFLAETATTAASSVNTISTAKFVYEGAVVPELTESEKSVELNSSVTAVSKPGEPGRFFILMPGSKQVDPNSVTPKNTTAATKVVRNPANRRLAVAKAQGKKRGVKLPTSQRIVMPTKTTAEEIPQGQSNLAIAIESPSPPKARAVITPHRFTIPLQNLSRQQVSPPSQQPRVASPIIINSTARQSNSLPSSSTPICFVSNANLTPNSSSQITFTPNAAYAGLNLNLYPQILSTLSLVEKDLKMEAALRSETKPKLIPRAPIRRFTRKVHPVVSGPKVVVQSVSGDLTLASKLITPALMVEDGTPALDSESVDLPEVITLD